MKKTILSMTIASLILSGCASLGSPEYQIKVNGAEISEETKTPRGVLIAGGVIIAGVVLGLSLISDDDAGGISDEDRFNDCIAAGLPPAQCRDLVT